MDLTIPLLFLIYGIAYIIMYIRDKGDPFYIRKKGMTSIPAIDYLRKEIVELEEELGLAKQQTNPDRDIIKEIEKELDAKRTHYNKFYN